MSEDERILTLTHRSAVGNHISMKLIDLPICMQRGQRDTLDYTFPPHVSSMRWQWLAACLGTLVSRQTSGSGPVRL